MFLLSYHYVSNKKLNIKNNKIAKIPKLATLFLMFETKSTFLLIFILKRKVSRNK